MLQLPRLSAPLVKDIRTGEGIFEWATGAALAAATVTSHLSFAHGALYVTILAGIKAARRGLLKIVALQEVAGVGDPIPASRSLSDAAQAIVSDAAEFASQPPPVAPAVAPSPAAVPAPGPIPPAVS